MRHLFLFPNVACSSFASFCNGSVYGSPSYSHSFGCFFDGTECLDKLSRSREHFNRVCVVSAKGFCKSLSRILVCVVVFTAAPFKIIYSIISSCFIYMVNKWKVVGIWNKSLRNKTMNMTISIYSIFCKRNPVVSISTNGSFKDPSAKTADIGLLKANSITNACVGESFNPSQIRHFIKAFVAFYLFPYLFHIYHYVILCKDNKNI